MLGHAKRFLAVVACLGITNETRADLLGTASTFAVLGASTVTNTGLSAIVGDVGVATGTSMTGFTPDMVTGGSFHSNDPAAIQAQADASSAYATLAAMTMTRDLTGLDLGGMTLTPGVYRFGSAAQLNGLLTLDGLGQAAPMFVFQVGTSLTTASASTMVLVDGATSGNVFFQVADSATLGTASIFAGTIIASASDTLTTGAEVQGRVIALNGAVGLDTNQIIVPASVPEPCSLILCGVAGIIGLAARQVRRRHPAA